MCGFDLFFPLQEEPCAAEGANKESIMINHPRHSLVVPDAGHVMLSLPSHHCGLGSPSKTHAVGQFGVISNIDRDEGRL